VADFLVFSVSERFFQNGKDKEGGAVSKMTNSPWFFFKNEIQILGSLIPHSLDDRCG